jgi:MFS family permease
MSTPPATPPAPPGPAVEGSKPQEEQGLTESQKRALVVVGTIVAILIVAGLIAGTVFLVGHPDQASTWRDVFIIFMALEFMLIGVAVIVLMVQLAVLTNLLRHEIKPILEATQETVNTVRGTTVFVSENLVEPVMKLNSYVAGMERLIQAVTLFMGLGRNKK